MRTHLLLALVAGVLGASSVAAPARCAAQSGSVLLAEGISNDIDRKRRSPVVSVDAFYADSESEDAQNGGPRGRILVDAYIPNPEYQKYPIRVDYYINRNFFTSQLRSTELPGALGIDVGADVATPPFNYSIVATLLHPNREFTTVMHGAIFENSLRAAIERCSITVTALQSGTENSTEQTTYLSSDVTVTRISNEQFSLAFTSSQLEDGSGAEEITASTTFSISASGAVSGTLVSTLAGRSDTDDVTGTATVEDLNLTSLDVTSADGFTRLSCD